MAEEQPSESVQKQSKKRISFFSRILIILVVILAYLVLKVTLIIIPYPTISVDYMEEYSKITRPDNYEPNENAALYYKKASEVFWDLPHVGEQGMYIWSSDINDAEVEIAKKWLALNSEAVSYLEQAVSKPYYWVQRDLPLSSQGMLGISLKDYDKLKFHHLASFLNLQAKVMMREGDTQRALEYIVQLHKMGAHLCGPKALIEQLVGFRFRGMAVDNTLAALDRGQFDSATLKDWQEKLEHQIYDSSKELDFRSEKCLAYDIIQRTFTDNGKGNGRLIPRSASELLKTAIIIVTLTTENGVQQVDRDSYLKFIWLALVGPDRLETVAAVDKVFAYVDTLKHQTPWQLHTQGIDSDGEINRMLEGYAIEKIPSVYRVIELYQRLKAKESALITIIAILRYKEDKEQFPENLDQLVSAGYLKQLPMDPYSDKPLVYKRLDSNFMLYSLGADFDDDGGMHSRWGQYSLGGDQVFWPVQKSEEKLTE